jgi:lysophospholipase L1-like esterase
MRMTTRSLCAPIVFISALLACGRLHADTVYLALGDSNTFGNDESIPSSTMPNSGDQGFVWPFANFLGSLNGGVRPQVVNLAISGELSTSFLTGVPPADWTSRAWQLNTHYANATTTQNSLMLAALDAAHAASNTVYVTLQFGTNDFNHLVASAAWQTATPNQQAALFTDLLNQVALNYETVLTEVQAHAPGAHILLPGFFDTLIPNDPGFATNELAIAAGNQALQQIAPAFGATYVDFYSVVNGHVLDLTNHQVPGGGHLNQAGYSAVALALDAAVPEPASLAMLGVGLVGVAGYGWRRRRVEAGLRSRPS